MAKVYCPGCKQLLEHDRGHLPLHMTDIQRGQLVTGSKVCDYSNKKIVTECASAEYTYECPDCGMETSLKVTEEYPGAFTEGIKPWIEIDCIGCSVSHDGHYCSNPGCGLEVIEQTAEFYRVSDSVNRYLPKLPDEEKMPAYRDFDTEADAGAYIASLTKPDDDPDRYNLDAMQPGWYEVRRANEGVGLRALQGIECRAALRDPKLLLMSGGSAEHQGVFKPEFHKTVRVTDGHLIDEEPEPGEIVLDSPTTAPAGSLICDCCNLARPELPYEHQYDDGRPSQVYCQECYDAGCDDECAVRAQARQGRTHA